MPTDAVHARRPGSGIVAGICAAMLAVLVAFGTPALAQRRPLASRPAFELSGNVKMDLLLQPLSPPNDSAVSFPAEARLSPLRAALYSAAIPGAGQLYAGNYGEAAGFAALEVVAVVLTVRFYAMGDGRENAFQKYADGYEPGIGGWSVVKYAQWMYREYHTYVPASVLAHDPVTNASASRPWDGVDWNYLHEWEQAIASLASPYPNNFTHLLPVRPDQQYYELIGKYPQYAGGWDDGFGYTYQQVIDNVTSPHFLHYRDMRGEANHFYRNGAAWSAIIIGNHLLSALEAAWNAAHVNHRIRLETRVLPVDRGIGVVELVPTASVSVAF
jgi:hypothetical protein